MTKKKPTAEEIELEKKVEKTTEDVLDHFKKICEAQTFTMSITIKPEKAMLQDCAGKKTVEIDIIKKDGEMVTKFNLLPTKTLVLNILKLLFSERLITQDHLAETDALKKELNIKLDAARAASREAIDKTYTDINEKIKDLNKDVL